MIAILFRRDVGNRLSSLPKRFPFGGRRCDPCKQTKLGTALRRAQRLTLISELELKVRR